MKIYIEWLSEIPVGCRECKLKNKQDWFCQLVDPNIEIDEDKYYDNEFKHPNCPLKIID